MSVNAAEVLDVLLDAIADRVVAKLRQAPAADVTPIAAPRARRLILLERLVAAPLHRSEDVRLPLGLPAR